MGTLLSSHLETEFWARQWPWCYWHISRYRFSNWNADICRHGPSVSPWFSAMLSLAQPDLFLLFFPSSAVNAVLTVSYIIWWHQRKHSYGCRLGRSRHLWQICDKLHFFFFCHFHLEWWRIHTWEEDMDLPWWKWCYVSLNCYCFCTEGRGPVIFD